MSNPFERFSHRLVFSQDHRGMSCTALANQLHVNQSTVSSWRMGKTEPTLWMVPLIAEALRVPVEWLAFGIGPREDIDRNGRMGA